MTTEPPGAENLCVTGGEREVLEMFLELHRSVVVRKVDGLTEGDSRRRLVPSQTTLAGLIRHLTVVERNWFQCTLAGAGEPARGDTGDGNWTFELSESDTIASLVADYQVTCEESRRTAARFSLDDTAPHPDLGEVSLWWILVHMIEETARHAGHADILREQTDGATGALG